MTDREGLKGQIDALSPMGVRFVARLVEALSSPATAGPRHPGSPVPVGISHRPHSGHLSRDAKKAPPGEGWGR